MQKGHFFGMRLDSVMLTQPREKGSMDRVRVKDLDTVLALANSEGLRARMTMLELRARRAAHSAAVQMCLCHGSQKLEADEQRRTERPADGEGEEGNRKRHELRGGRRRVATTGLAGV